jgi:hypothetical protein
MVTFPLVSVIIASIKPVEDFNMRFVMEYSIGDEFTWHGTDIVPFEYESKEKFLYDMMTACLSAVEQKKYVFNFIGREFELLYFGYFKNKEKQKGFEFFEPRIQTLEEWFVSNLTTVKEGT